MPGGESRVGLSREPLRRCGMQRGGLMVSPAGTFLRLRYGM